MALDRRAQLTRQHLRAQTDAEKGRARCKHAADEIDFRANKTQIVIRAHGAAEDDHGAIARGIVGQRIAERGVADIGREPARGQKGEDASGTRLGAVKDEQDG